MKLLLYFIFSFLFTCSSVWATPYSLIENKKLDLQKTQKLTAKVEHELHKRKVRVAILSRVGLPDLLRPNGVSFSHVAFVVNIRSSSAKYAIYEMIPEDKQPKRSALLKTPLKDFFKKAIEAKAGVLIPSDQLQQRLLEIIGSPTYKALHNFNYSVIANPYNEEYQNCTEFTLDVINAAIYKTSDIKELKQIARNNFIAQPIGDLFILALPLAVLRFDVSISDQIEGAITTATFETIRDYLLKYDKGAEYLEIAL